jgi:hypothetical protein
MLKSKLVNGFNSPTSQKKVIIPKGTVYAFTPLDIREDVLPTMVRTEEVHSFRYNLSHCLDGSLLLISDDCHPSMIQARMSC